MSRYQSVNKLADMVRVEFGGGVGIEHGGVVDVLALASEGGFDGQGLDVDAGLHQGSKPRWQG